jgi:AcrR family transcriptional regulator
MISTTRDRIDAAALRLFSEKGVSEVSVRDLAAATGMSEGGLYRHFTSKEELAARVFAQAYRDVAARMEDAVAKAGPAFADRARAVVTTIYDAFDSDSVLLRFLLLRQHDALPRVEATDDTPMAVVLRLVAAGQTEGAVEPTLPPTAAAAAFVGLVLEPLTFRLYGAITEPAAAHVGTTTDLLLHALAPRVGQNPQPNPSAL